MYTDHLSRHHPTIGLLCSGFGEDRLSSSNGLAWAESVNLGLPTEVTTALKELKHRTERSRI